jgi:hypothetical protein
MAVNKSGVNFIVMPDVFGAEWLEASGTHFQLFVHRGGSTVSMGIRSKNNVEWMTTPVVNPERFGSMPIATAKQFRAWVEAFLAAGDKEASG